MTVHHWSRRVYQQGLRIAFVTLLGCSLTRPAPAADGPSLSRVRSSDPSLAALIDRAAQDSATFQTLLRTLEMSDGIVYVEPGECGHGVWACLKMWMNVSGPNRYVRILVNRRKAASDVDCMGGIGHELQHAIEALSQPGITNGVQLVFSSSGAKGGLTTTGSRQRRRSWPAMPSEMSCESAVDYAGPLINRSMGRRKLTPIFWVGCASRF